ncbi:MAG: tellurite resistance/C4-dicarboxylate transporter family protein [Bacteroidetes bacterium]|nr:tellurite resistance/C4-dicarboxylate transporter family protein [Bacteroidota bacterium]MBS1739952.1 tellurite resistance/C4-dicarboxylate transporter family protein [Bacteroidota bacterium]
MITKRLTEGIQSLSPAYFSLPMATGIIAIASFTIGYSTIGSILLWVNNIVILSLVLLLLIRVIFFFPLFLSDLDSQNKGSEFLSIVAALSLCGSANLLIAHRHALADFCLISAIFLWTVFSYGFLFKMVRRNRKHSLYQGIDGAWLLLVVSLEGLSILSNLLAEIHPPIHELLFLIALGFHLLGMWFYLTIIMLLFYRLLFLPWRDLDFNASYWITMGAASIITLAGSMFIQSLPQSNLLDSIIPSIKVATIFFWVVACWWIPLLVYLEIEKLHHTSFRYHAGSWSFVFPLGVFTMCTWHLAQVMQIPYLKLIPEKTIFLAWIAWIVVFIAMCQKWITAKKN